MTSIEFGKKCRPYNLKYKDLFGYVPCKDNYICSQEEFFEALVKAVELGTEITAFVPKRNISYSDPAVKY